MTDFKTGDRVLVTDPGLAALRKIMRDATGEEPAPNHHGTVVEVWESGSILINFDDGGGAPYPPDEVRHLEPSTEKWECSPHANAWNGHDARCRRVPVDLAVPTTDKDER